MLLVISGDQSERRPIWRGEIIPMQLSWRRKDHPGDLTVSGGECCHRVQLVVLMTATYQTARGPYRKCRGNPPKGEGDARCFSQRIHSHA